MYCDAGINYYANEKDIKVHISDCVVEEMIELTRYLEFGARKVDQVIEDEIDDYVIDSILEGKREVYVNSN